WRTPARGRPMTGVNGVPVVVPPDIDALLQWEKALASACRFLASPAGAPDPHDAELRECLRRCRAHLTEVIEASPPYTPPLRTVDQAAAALGVPPLTVYRLISSGKLAAYRISKRAIRVGEQALRDYLARNVVGQGGLDSHDIPLHHLPPHLQ